MTYKQSFQMHLHNLGRSPTVNETTSLDASEVKQVVANAQGPINLYDHPLPKGQLRLNPSTKISAQVLIKGD